MYTLDGKYINDLEDIPEDCQILLVSENPPPKEQAKRMTVGAEHDGVSDLQKSLSDGGLSIVESLQDDQPKEIIGLKNNIYKFDTRTEYMKQKVKQVETSIHDKKHKWLEKNLAKWHTSTPHIYDYHKDADQKLHKTGTKQTFVTVKRIPPKLPELKSIVTPFMTDAIQEELHEEAQFESLMKDGKYEDRYLKPAEANDEDKHFSYKNPMLLKEPELLTLSQRGSSDVPKKQDLTQNSQQKRVEKMRDENAEKFEDNPHLRNMVDQIEFKHLKRSSIYDPKKAPENSYKDKEKDRVRRFKKPMDTL